METYQGKRLRHGENLLLLLMKINLIRQKCFKVLFALREEFILQGLQKATAAQGFREGGRCTAALLGRQNIFPWGKFLMLLHMAFYFCHILYKIFLHHNLHNVCPLKVQHVIFSYCAVQRHRWKGVTALIEKQRCDNKVQVLHTCDPHTAHDRTLLQSLKLKSLLQLHLSDVQFRILPFIPS